MKHFIREFSHYSSHYSLISQGSRETLVDVQIQDALEVLVLNLGHDLDQSHQALEHQQIKLVRVVVEHEYIEEGVENVLQELHDLL